jgi:uncharacterized protein with GYD domain
MPAYVILGKFTDKGAQDVVAVRKSHDAVDGAIARVGGRLIARYYVFGEYDYVTMIEMPGDEEVLRGALSTASSGLTRSAVLRAFTAGELDAALSRGTFIIP